ncbi:MAG: AAA family ATPase [Candidatus Paceibacterota bacterium]
MEEKEALEKDKKALAAKLDACTKEIDSLKEQLNAAESSDDSFHAEFKAAFSVLENAKEALAAVERELSALALDKERAAMKRSDLLEQLEQAGKKVADFEPSTEDLNDSQVHEIERLMLSLRAELSSIGDVDNTLIQESKDMEERHAYLVKESEDLEKACSDLKVLIKDLKEKLHSEFKKALVRVNEEFNKYFHAMFVGGKARLSFIQEEVVAAPAEEGEEVEVEGVSDEEDKNSGGLDIEISIPRKNIKGLDMLSGGERSLTSIAVLFALVSVSPPPFLVLDEVDAALDENNTKRFASLIHEFSEKTQFMVVTHNRATMGEADVLYGVTMGDDGTSTVLSLKFDQAVRSVE